MRAVLRQAVDLPDRAGVQHRAEGPAGVGAPGRDGHRVGTGRRVDRRARPGRRRRRSSALLHVVEEGAERLAHLVEVDQERVVAVRRVDLDVLGRRPVAGEELAGSAAAGRAGRACRSRCRSPASGPGCAPSPPRGRPGRGRRRGGPSPCRAPGSCWRRSGGRACRRGSRGSARPRSAATGRSWSCRASASSRPKRSVNTSSVRNVTWATMRATARPSCGPVAGRGVVVVAAAPARVEPDRPPADRTPRDLLGGGLRARGDGDERAHPVRVRDAPLEHLHPAHRAADHASASGSTPRWSARRAWARTMSRIVTTGKRRAVRPAGRPDRATPGRSSPGSRRARWRTRRSTGRCRAAARVRRRPPTSPGVGWPGPAGPAAWLSPVQAWQTRTALEAVASSVPQVS